MLFLINLVLIIFSSFFIHFLPLFTVLSGNFEEKSETIFFDPLIKLNKSITLNPPSYLQPDTKYTQFFTGNNFDSLINRNISGFLNMQRMRNLADATREKIIDNNIKYI